MDVPTINLIAACTSLNILMLSLLLCLKTKTTRRWWVRPLNLKRDEDGYFAKIYRTLKTTDHEEFFEFTRMSPRQFDNLLKAVSPYLQKSSNRKGLEPELRLALTVSYLAHGDSIKSKAWQFRVGKSTTYAIIEETCGVIYTALQKVYLPAMDKGRWKTVADGFQEKWQFPNCLGAVDGKHIRIHAPKKSGSKFFNYKKFFSIVLMATCDALCRFTWVDIGQYGSISDGGVWDHTSLCTALEANQVNLPSPEKLPESDIVSHFSFVADAAFPLKKYIMRPYPGNNLGLAERVFNYRLSRARRTIESAFGILVSRWRILHSNIGQSPSRITRMVSALVVLHNFIMTDESSLPPESHRYQNVRWTSRGHHNHSCDVSHCPDATRQRDLLRNYFVSHEGEAQVPWQYNSVNAGFNINLPNLRVPH